MRLRRPETRLCKYTYIFLNYYFSLTFYYTELGSRAPIFLSCHSIDFRFHIYIIITTYIALTKQIEARCSLMRNEVMVGDFYFTFILTMLLWWMLPMIQPGDRGIVLYERGCLRAGEEWVEVNLIPVAGVAVGVAILQVSKFICKKVY